MTPRRRNAREGTIIPGDRSLIAWVRQEEPLVGWLPGAQGSFGAKGCVCYSECGDGNMAH